MQVILSPSDFMKDFIVMATAPIIIIPRGDSVMSQPRIGTQTGGVSSFQDNGLK